MSDKPPETPDDLIRQLTQHIDSLRAAGLEWVPTAPLPEVQPSPSLPAASPLPMAPVDASPVQVSLFVASSADAPAADDPEQRRRELALLAQRVAGCMRCPQLASTAHADGLRRRADRCRPVLHRRGPRR